MIQLKVELVPHGFGVPKQIGLAEIANVTERDRADYKTLCDYEVSFSSDDGQSGKVRLERFDKSKGFWTLLHAALSKYEAERG